MRTRLLALCAALALPLGVLTTPPAHAADTHSAEIVLVYALTSDTGSHFYIWGNVDSKKAACRTNRTIKVITIAPDLSKTVYGTDSSGSTNHWGLDVPLDADFKLVLTRKKLPNGDVCSGASYETFLGIPIFDQPDFPDTGNTILEFYNRSVFPEGSFTTGAIDSDKGRCVKGRTVKLQTREGDRWKTIGSDTTAGSGDTFAIAAPAHDEERVIVLARTVGSVKCDRYVYVQEM